MFPKIAIGGLVLFKIFVIPLFGQDSTCFEKLTTLPGKYTDQVYSKVSNLQDKLSEQSLKVLKRFSKQEAVMKRKLASTDTAAANRIFGDVAGRYNSLEQKLQQPQKLTQ